MAEHFFHAGWGDMDFNGHMANRAYLDKAADARMVHFAAAGFPMSEFSRLRLGPVILKDELLYFREIGLLDPVRITTSLAGLSEWGERYEIRNEFFRADGKPAARISSLGGFLDLDRRRLTTPPPALLRAVRSLSVTEDFRPLAPDVTGR